MKYFISLINNTIPFGRGLNALSHTALGLGHLLPEGALPSIKVLFADTQTIRMFRQKSHEMALMYPKRVLCAEFTNTMTVGDTAMCLKITSETPESELTYYAVSICAEEELLQNPAFQEIFNECRTLKNYEPYMVSEAEGNFSFKESINPPDYRSLAVRKLALILDRNVPAWELVNAAVVASMGIGKKASLDQLRLLMYIDASNQTHPYISYHSFPILAAKKQDKFKELALHIEKDSNVIFEVVKSNEGMVIGVCILAREDEVNAYTYQKFISFWTLEVPSDAF